jgi:hypothetical protein
VGGVGLNVATAAHYVLSAKMGSELARQHLHFVTCIGEDMDGSSINSTIDKRGLSRRIIRPATPEASSTATYVSINDKAKDLVLGMADMRIFETEYGTHHPLYSSLKHYRKLAQIEPNKQSPDEAPPGSEGTPPSTSSQTSTTDLAKSPWVILDANWKAEAIQATITDPANRHFRFAYEPVSAAKAGCPKPLDRLHFPQPHHYSLDTQCP